MTAEESEHSYIDLAASTRKAWTDWLAVAGERVHVDHELLDPDVGRHTALCINAARISAERLSLLWNRPQPPARILDIGCSAGFKAIALNSIWPQAQVIGIDPDDRAVELGRAIISDPAVVERMAAQKMPRLEFGYAEKTGWPDGHFDLVICLTTIEHVANVARTIGEIARVLSVGGVALIEAPNYLWPTEPHLGVIVPPLAPKAVMRFCARLQGRADLAWYVNHLKLVHPRMVERLFTHAGLRFENLAREKLMRVASGDDSDVVAHRGKAQLLSGLRCIGFAAPLARLVGAAGLYPSLMYRLEREPI